MAFRVTQKCLESLEWPEVISRLAHHCRTPQARLRLGADPLESDAFDDSHAQVGGVSGASRELTTSEPRLPASMGEFEGTLAGVTLRLAETCEARALLENGEYAPLGGSSDLRLGLRRAAMGGVLPAQQLLDVRSSLETLRTSIGYVEQRSELAPNLADLAGTAEAFPKLESTIGNCLDPSGEVRDAASPALAQARRDVNALSSELQSRLARYLRDPNVKDGLSDSFYTVRNDRYVLPVRADHKSKVRGIVHDASRSGTTLFIEPEAVVELNNKLKQAELTQAREVERVLKELSEKVAEIRPGLVHGLEVLGSLDLAFARAHLAIEMDATAPRVDREGVFRLPRLRHPLLPPEESIPNDLELGADYSVLVISGPNGGGKTVAMKAVGLACLMVRMGLQVPAGAGARVDLVDDIQVDIGDGQDLRESLSTFSAHMMNLAEIVRAATPHSLILLDEIGVGTDPSEGAALAQAILETLAESGARGITTTHYNLLKEMAEIDQRFCNASVEFDPDTLAPTYRLHTGTAGVSSATAVAARMGMPPTVLDRANALLEREDRQLDQMLSELAHSRVTLEREKQEAIRIRAESELVRGEYRVKLERLQERRDKLFQSMREDLDRTFSDAHAQVAAVIRDLQRSGQGDTRAAAHGAAHARERLLGLETSASEAEARGVDSTSSQGEASRAVDWRRAGVGDPVIVPGGNRGVIESLPDRRGRVRVRVGSAKVEVESDRLRAGSPADLEHEAPPQKTRGSLPSEGSDADQVAGGTLEHDLRGQRVDEAEDSLAESIDRALHMGHEYLRIIHGMGTGALRAMVRNNLKHSPHVVAFRPGGRGEGGDGVTIAEIRR